MIIWLASYPKSGNTWVRSLLSAYLFSEDGKFNFELLKKINQFSIKNSILNNTKTTDLKSKISKNWIPYQQIINKDKKIHFLKTHNALCTVNGNKFTDQFNTITAVYIVRDPRNIITSLSHHYELSTEEAYEFITNERKIIFPKKGFEDFNFLGNWASHYLSWKNIGFCPVKIIKYEDLLNDAQSVFTSLLDFLLKFIKFEINKEKINNVIDTTSFERLNQMEQEHGFDESITSLKSQKKIKFFNLGEENNWKNLLDNKIAERIGGVFKSEMRELKYL